MKPWIHPFKTFSASYFYDVNRNEIIKISSAAYDALERHKELSYDALKAVANEEIKNMMQRGYLKANPLKAFRNPSTDFIDVYIERKLNRLTLQVTQECNLRCRYCAYTQNRGTNRVHSTKKMSDATMQKAVDYLHSNSVDSKAILIGFYGGEPLLEFEFIKRTVNYAKQKFRGRKIQFNATINGTLLTTEILEFFIKWKFSLTFSIDGPKVVNDVNRIFAFGTSSVFDTVIEKLQIIHEHYYDYFKTIGINMVIDPDNDFGVYKALFVEYPFLRETRVTSTLVDDFHLKVKRNINPDFITKYYHAQFLSLMSEMNELKDCDLFFENVTFANTSEMVKGISAGSLRVDNFIPSGLCTPGLLKVFVTVDGDYLPCERVSESHPLNYIGDVNSGLNVEKCARMMNLSISNFDNCMACEALRHCFLCAKDYEEKNINEPLFEERCLAVKQSFYRKIYKNSIYKEISEGL